MKKILLVSTVSLLISGCAMFRSPYIKTSSALDYSQYTEKGLFLTESNSVNFSYTPMASVSAVFLSGYEPVLNKRGEIVKTEAYDGSSIIKTTRKHVKSTEAGVLEELTNKAIALGANGIINLQLRTLSNYDVKTGYQHYGYEATGMAIKK